MIAHRSEKFSRIRTGRSLFVFSKDAERKKRVSPLALLRPASSVMSYLVSIDRKSEYFLLP